MKAETKHTPGPWTVGRTITGSDPNLVARGVNGDGKMVYDAMIEALSYFVAGVGGVGKEECLANANLIAAAPDLLQVCKEELDALETWIRNETVRGDVLEGMLISRQKITAAIAKAKGNQ